LLGVGAGRAIAVNLFVGDAVLVAVDLHDIPFVCHAPSPHISRIQRFLCEYCARTRLHVCQNGPETEFSMDNQPKRRDVPCYTVRGGFRIHPARILNVPPDEYNTSRFGEHTSSCSASR
jgi:hypothetical protein